MNDASNHLLINIDTQLYTKNELSGFQTLREL